MMFAQNPMEVYAQTRRIWIKQCCDQLATAGQSLGRGNY